MNSTLKRWLCAAMLTASTPAAVWAADARVPAQPPVHAPQAYAAPTYTWTGLYVGGHIGGAWAPKDWSFPILGFDTRHTSSGFLGGGQVGVNYQVGTWVFGAEGDFSWIGGDGRSNCDGSSCRTRFDWLSTVTGRLGVTTGPALIYAKAGGAWGADRYNISTGGITAGSAATTRSGWTAGLGLEFMLTPNWSAKAEYNYADLGRDRVITNTGTRANVTQTAHVAKFGLNYRFNWDGPPVLPR